MKNYFQDLENKEREENDSIPGAYIEGIKIIDKFKKHNAAGAWC